MVTQILQCTPDYPCADYPVCRLSVHDRKLLIANGQRWDVMQRDVLKQNPEYSNRNLSCVSHICIVYVIKQLEFYFLHFLGNPEKSKAHPRTGHGGLEGKGGSKSIALPFL
jgi:hypothetical protein